MKANLIDYIADELQSSPEEVRVALREMLRPLRDEAASSEEVFVEELGTFRLDGDDIRFEPVNELELIANHDYASFAPLSLESISGVTKDPEDPSIETKEGPHWREALDQQGQSEVLGPDPNVEDAEYEVVEDDTLGKGQASKADTNPAKSSPPSTTGQDKKEWLQVVPYSGVLFQPNLPESAFVGAELEVFRPSEYAEKKRSSVASTADSREPVGTISLQSDAASAEVAVNSSDGKNKDSVLTDDGYNTWRWVATAALLLVILGGGWLVADHQGYVDGFFPLQPDQPDQVALDPPPLNGEAGAVPEDEEEETETEIDEDAEEIAENEAEPPTIERISGLWTIVVASETTREEAEEQLRAFYQNFEEEEDVPADILEGESGGQARFRAAIGQFDSQQSAAIALREYSERLPSGAWILEIDEDM